MCTSISPGSLAAMDSCFGFVGSHQHGIANALFVVYHGTVYGGSIYNKCANLGWEQPNRFGKLMRTNEPGELAVRMSDVLATSAWCYLYGVSPCFYYLLLYSHFGCNCTSGFFIGSLDRGNQPLYQPYKENECS